MIKKGNMYGRLTAIRDLGVKGGNRYWLFRCSCGNKKKIQSSNVLYYSTKSCGCLRSELMKNCKNQTKHGMSDTHFYNIWKHVKRRCFNKNANEYVNYGGRGISCEWSTFDDFKKDMHTSYIKHRKESGKKNTTLDRIDNNGNYSKNNCRWATRGEQMRNTRANQMFTIGGKTKCFTDWANESDLPNSTIHARVFRLGWDIEKALTTQRKHASYKR